MQHQPEASARQSQSRLGLFSAILTLAICCPALADEDPAKPDPPSEKAAATKLLPWHRSLAPALEESRRRKSLILVRVGASWCGWCRRLDKEIVLPEVQKELAGWTLVELDADDDQDEVKRLSVGPIPALRVLDSTGHKVRSHDGYLPGEDLIDWLRGKESDSAREAPELITEIPDLDQTTLPQLARLLSHRDANVREAVSRRLALNKGLAGPEVAKVFTRGKLGARLAALDLLISWQAPVKDLDPWQPETITSERLSELEDWAATLTADEEASKVVPLSEEELAEARAEVAKIVNADAVEMEAIGARLARYGDRLLATVRELRAQATSDQARERLDWLRYRLVASDALMLKWPGGLIRLAATDAKSRHDAATELPGVVTSGDESLLIELFGHPDAFVRELSLKALHGVGGQRASNELTRLLSDPEPNVRAAVLKQMAEKPSHKVVPQIAEYIARETDPDLIVHAARLLREIKHRDAVECLEKLFTHSSWQVRAEAVEAVGELVSDRHSSSNTKLATDVVADAYVAILDVLNDGDGFVVSRAVTALKGSDLTIAAGPLATTAEKHPELADVIAEALIAGARSKSIPILEKWLKHQHENLRAASLKALRQANSLEGTALITALTDNSEKVRIAAAVQLLQMCESARPIKERTAKATRVSSRDSTIEPSAPAPAPQSTSLIGQALGALLGTKPATKPTQKPPKPPTDDPPTVQAPDEPKVVAKKPVPDNDPERQPFEEWLIKFRSGEGREQWMTDAVVPLKNMFQSMSAHERVAAGQALVALGDNGVVAELLQLAAKESAFALPVATVLRWQPWDQRVETFKALRPLISGPEPLSHLCQEFVVLRDTRAGQHLWDVLSDEQVEASLAHSLYVNLLRVHGIELRYGYYIDRDKPQDPIAFDAATVKGIVADSKSIWQRRVALVLLWQFDKLTALESSKSLMADEQAPQTLRTDAFIINLLLQSPKEAQQSAVTVLVDRNTVFAHPAIALLTLGRSELQSLADGHFRLPDLSGGFTEYPSQPTDKQLPKELTPEHVLPYLTNPDEELAARAAYLLALLGDPAGVDKLIDHWRRVSTQGHGDNQWHKPVYEAIAATDDPKYVPILQDIYETMRQNESYAVRDLYWTIRAMHGPEILKLRKKIRDEVGMDQLR